MEWLGMQARTGGKDHGHAARGFEEQARGVRWLPVSLGSSHPSSKMVGVHKHWIRALSGP